MADEPKVLGDSQARFLVHLGTRMAPGIAGLDRRGVKRFRLVIRRMLLRRSAAERFQVRLLLFVIRWLPAPVFLRPFERIPRGAQDWILRRFETAPFRLLRAGFWGLKTLVFMGHYGQPNVAREIHYTPDLRRGNDYLETAANPPP